MRHLNPELEKLEQRVAPGLFDIEGDIEVEAELTSSIEAELELEAELSSSSAEAEFDGEVELG